MINVAPLVGAWIEITVNGYENYIKDVAPLVGAWIEISEISACTPTSLVAPLVGAWIEIHDNRIIKVEERSLLSWERGLKYT